MTSVERVRRLLAGQAVDYVPVFDLLRNDAAIEYYSGEKITFENAQQLVYKAVGKALDSTRPTIKAPQPDSETIGEDGRKTKTFRWTTWGEHLTFANEDEYAKHLYESYQLHTPEEIKARAASSIQRNQGLMDAVGDLFLFWSLGGPGLQYLFGVVGLEAFSYYLVDVPEAISHAMEVSTINSINLIKEIHTQTKDDPKAPEVYFMSEDMAFKSGCLFNPTFMCAEFYPRLKRIAGTIHETGKKLCFHSDGNLMNVLDNLVDCGIDILNPIEINADMDIAEIHRRYPNLYMTGGVDVSQLLPRGTPEEVEAAAFKAIRDSGGKIMIGSSTEMNHEVPLENVLALYNAPKKFKG
ncbi:MAG: hypothetical protein FWE11_10425 [Defluviitaleaceae bacterium]|nr:hypothetical protein [Defluviitaleaceae bacterium]